LRQTSRCMSWIRIRSPRHRHAEATTRRTATARDCVRLFRRLLPGGRRGRVHGARDGAAFRSGACGANRLWAGTSSRGTQPRSFRCAGLADVAHRHTAAAGFETGALRGKRAGYAHLRPGRLEGIEPQEPNLPPDVATYPEIAFSTGQSWQGMATEYSKIVDSRANASQVQAILDQLIAGKRGVAEKEGAILDYWTAKFAIRASNGCAKICIWRAATTPWEGRSFLASGSRGRRRCAQDETGRGIDSCQYQAHSSLTA